MPEADFFEKTNNIDKHMEGVIKKKREANKQCQK